MRRTTTTLLLASALVVGLAACGDDDGTGPAPGTLVLEGGMECPSVQVAISVDGGQEVQASLQPGETVRSFSLSAGTHTIAARMIDGELFWPELAMTIESKRTYTVVMQCT